MKLKNITATTNKLTILKAKYMPVFNLMKTGIFLFLALYLVSIKEEIKYTNNGQELNQLPKISQNNYKLFHFWINQLSNILEKSMGVRSADADYRHLYPPFYEKLEKVLKETEIITQVEWFMMEGYRSAERQQYLYSLGRTRPGKIVTWMKNPLRHGAGIAADLYPLKKPFSSPISFFESYRKVYLSHGLMNSAWGKGDLGHVEWANEEARQKGFLYVRNGFHFPPDALPAIKVYYKDHLVEDADAYLENDHIWVKLRPITDTLDLTIANVSRMNDIWKAQLISDHLNISVPIILKNKVGYCQLSNLPIQPIWNSQLKTVRILKDL